MNNSSSSKANPISIRHKRPFTLQEDQELIIKFQQSTSNSLNYFSKEMATVLNRSKESIRDWLRKYLLQISQEERGLIKVMSILSAKQFLVFGSNNEGQKVIIKLVQNQISQKQSLKQMKANKDSKKFPGVLADLTWLQNALENKDETFSERILIYFTESILTVFMDLKKVKFMDIVEQVSKMPQQFSFKELMDQIYPLFIKQEGDYDK